MKVHGDYGGIISRILESEKKNTGLNTRLSAQVSEDRQELSRLLSRLQQELKAEATPSSERVERLRRLEAAISRGEYRVDDEALAAAMLEI